MLSRQARRKMFWGFTSLLVLMVAFTIFLATLVEETEPSNNSTGKLYTIIYHPNNTAQITIHRMDPDNYAKAIPGALEEIKKTHKIIEIKRVFANTIHVIVESKPPPQTKGSK